MRRSLHTEALAVVALPLDTIATDTTTEGTTVDLAVFGNRFRDSVLFQVITGTVTDGEYEVAVTESDNDSDYTAVPAYRVHGDLPTITDANSDTLYQFAVVPGTARYLRLELASTDTTNGAVLAAVAVLTGSNENPVRRS